MEAGHGRNTTKQTVVKLLVGRIEFSPLTLTHVVKNITHSRFKLLDISVHLLSQQGTRLKRAALKDPSSTIDKAIASMKGRCEQTYQAKSGHTETGGRRLAAAQQPVRVMAQWLVDLTMVLPV